MLIGAAVVWFFFPKADRERELLASYQAEDTRSSDTPASAREAGTTPAAP